ncbi:hypothetical protein ACE6H2_024983 [Prunus campanulata]
MIDYEDLKRQGRDDDSSLLSFWLCDFAHLLDKMMDDEVLERQSRGSKELLYDSEEFKQYKKLE